MLREVLKKYWGYDKFRPLQEDIIQSAVDGYDTLALLPTGGGKSLCFQVPGLVREGVCLVISPLIALMKDQVFQLKKRHIRAEAIFTGMSRLETDAALDAAQAGSLKFLYVSPERIQSQAFRQRLKNMKVGLLAVDESHCIAQWGYDFRPHYLQIAEIRPLIGEQIPCIALTATATLEVREDIIDKLKFRENHNVFVKSFARSNLSYSCFEEEDKGKKLLQILRNVKGTSVVYVRSRLRTQSIAKWLRDCGISADYYHAGLGFQQRNIVQEEWIANKTRVIVATNAFGMGIDKPDVRTVVHLDIPDTLEAYFQEAGRAGRDEKKAYAVLLYDQNDIRDLEKNIAASYPSLQELGRVYQALANYFKIAVGSHSAESYDFNVADFCKNFGLPPATTYYAIKRLEEQGFIQLSEAFYKPSRLQIKFSKYDLYDFQIRYPNYDLLIKTIMRMHGGKILDNLVRISEDKISEIIQKPKTEVIKQIRFLSEQGVCIYEEQKNRPQLSFLSARYAAADLPLDRQLLEERRKGALHRGQKAIHYATHTQICRTQLLLAYFGEHDAPTCGVCDICIAKRKGKKQPSESEKEPIRQRILHLLQTQAYRSESLLEAVSPVSEAVFKEALRELHATNMIKVSREGRWELQEA